MRLVPVAICIHSSFSARVHEGRVQEVQAEVIKLNRTVADPGAACVAHGPCKDLGIEVGNCCPKENGKYLGCCTNRPAKSSRRRKPKREKAPKASKNSDPGPIYKCETVPTYKLDVYLSCQRHKYKPALPTTAHAACFSLAPYSQWACPDSKQGPKFLEEDGMSRSCRMRSDDDRNPYDGRCLMKGHAEYAKAVDFTGGGIDWGRRTRGPRHQKPPKHANFEYPVAKPSGTIGWNPTSKRVAVGKWCEVGVPANGWTPGSCPSSKTTEVKVLSYNLYWWKLFGQRKGTGWIKTPDGGGYSKPRSAGRLMEKSGEERFYDLMAFQECDDVNRILSDARMQGSHESYAGRHAVAIAWKKSEWRSLGTGYADVSEDKGKPYWGYREVVFGRFEHKKTGKKVFFMNHHGPLPDRDSGGFCGAYATAFNLLRIASERAYEGDTIILTGDFNARKESPMVTALSKHMKHVYNGESFHGVDNFLTNCGEAVEKRNLGPGGSDHDALDVTFKI